MASPLFFIPGEVRSTKNSRVVFASGRNVPSKAAQAWKKQVRDHLICIKPQFLAATVHLPKPLLLGVHFMRKTKANYDWINMMQGVQDMLVEMGLVPDDNTNQLIPVPMKLNNNYSTHDKNQPGFVMCVLDTLSQAEYILNEPGSVM